MPVREALPAILRGEIAAELTLEQREHLESMAHDAQAEGLLAWVREETAGRLRQPGATRAVEYLLAAVCALNGEVERAHQTLLALGDRLVADAHWEQLAAVAERALALEETHAAVHLLVKAHEGLGRDPERIDALQRAWTVMPDDLELGLLLAVRLGDAGQGEHRRSLLAELMPRFAVEARYAGLEEAALEFVEHGAIDGLVRLIQTLPTLAEQMAFSECRTLLDIAFPAVLKSGRAGECHAAVREVAVRAMQQHGPAAGETYRQAVLESLRLSIDLPDAAGVLKASGLTDPGKPLGPALENFDLIAALAPGRAVHHDTFGPGRIASNDGDVVLTDFAHAKGHRMPYAAALRTLSALAEDDPRLLRLTQPAELSRLRADEPGELLVRTLRSIGGAADAQKLKVFLVGSQLVPPAEWTSFWRRARAAAEKDPRIDHARAFEQHYRLAPAGTGAAPDGGAPLPAIEPRKSLRTNLATVRRFLSQHPSAERPLAQRFGRFVARAVFDEEGDRTDRARAGIYFARWFPERRAEWIVVLGSLWEQGLAITDLPAEDEQLALLEVSHASGVEADAILTALDSRFAAVREEAARFRAQLDDAGRATLRTTLLQHATRYPSATVRLLEEALEAEQAPGDGWALFLAALALIEDRPKPSMADKILGWLEAGGAFDRLLLRSPCQEDARLRLRVLLRQWRSSDRLLFPALEAAARLGLADEVEAMRDHRKERSNRLFASVGQQAEDVELSVMTRATWAKLKGELDSLERELKTTIPATIQKARELGDLKENAEYHSAKLKQANVSKRVASLQKRLASARFVDDGEFRPGVVGLGTHVTLEDDDGAVHFWILGEGEQHLGEDVVSFQSAVGRALMNRKVGDEVELGEAEHRRRLRVMAVERRLPGPGSEAPSSEKD